MKIFEWRDCKSGLGERDQPGFVKGDSVFVGPFLPHPNHPENPINTSDHVTVSSSHSHLLQVNLSLKKSQFKS
jgi:hypothetical protein